MTTTILGSGPRDNPAVIAVTLADRCRPDPVAVARPGVSGTWALRDDRY